MTRTQATRLATLDAARQLFAERGFSSVTIRQIAAEAGISPAMVMKVGGNKERIYADAMPTGPMPLDPNTPRDLVGREVVARILERRDAGATEAWMQALLNIVDSSDPISARDDFRARYLAFVERQLVGSQLRAPRAEMVAALLIGLAAAVRPLRLLNEPNDREAVVERYGALVQDLLDSPVPR